MLREKAESIEEELSVDTLRVVKQAKEKGAGSWLSVIPLEEQGFTLTKSEIRDSLALRYKRILRGLPSKCPCGQQFDINHALNCKKVGFVIIQHYTI